VFLQSLARGRAARKPDGDEAPAETSSRPAAAKDEVRLGALEDYIAFHVQLAQNASFKAFQRLTGEPRLRPGWFAVLSLIDSNPGITPALLSRASGRDKSTLTPVLRDLTHGNLIERRPVPNDKRSYALALTPAGRDKLRELAKHAATHDRKLDKIVGPKKAELLAMLRRIMTLLD
jgi:DNA-binding MarR family transcriptional regulator